MGPMTRKLLAAVSRRRRVASMVSLFHRFFLILAAVYALALLSSRFFALIPLGYFDLRTGRGAVPLAATVTVALLASLFLARRPSASDAARLVDVRLHTHDVFLTAVRIEESYGEYKPLVLEDAESAAAKIVPRDAVPLRWLPQARNGTLAAAIIVLAAFFIPQFDLLGKNEERARLDERRKLIEETRKAAVDRLAALQKSQSDAQNSKEVESALTDLKTAFNQAKPKEIDANLRKLMENQKQLGQMWQQLSERKLKDALNQESSGQQFGVRSLEKQAEWKRQMSKGNASGLQKELKEVATMGRKLDELQKGSERTALEQEMKQRMENLSEFVERQMNSRPASAALARAMEQLGLSGDAALSKEAMEALQESLDLTGMELEKLAQSSRDLQSIEDALRALQMAKGVNKMQALDGEQCAGCSSMSDYADLYKKLMEAAKGGTGDADGEGDGEGDGLGMGGKGHGAGGKAAEKPDALSDFVPEQSRSALTAGKILMEWKTKGMTEAGSSKVEYSKQVENLKKGLSEAILHEQIPPGYHDAIQKYFDQHFKENPDAPVPK